MWFPCLLLFLAFSSVLADANQKLEACMEDVNLEELEDVLQRPEADDLAIACSTLIPVFECIERVVMDETGFSVEAIGEMMEDTEAGRFIDVYINTRNLFKDELCNEDAQLHKDYKESAHCYKTNSFKEHELKCGREAEAAFETFKAFEDVVQDEAGDDTGVDNRPCMIEAYKAACSGVEIHEKCGQKAFDTYMEIMRKTTIFRNGICTESQLADVKEKVLDNLEMDSSRKDLYRLAFELKKRRK